MVMNKKNLLIISMCLVGVFSVCFTQPETEEQRMQRIRQYELENSLIYKVLHNITQLKFSLVNLEDRVPMTERKNRMIQRMQNEIDRLAAMLRTLMHGEV
jgi:hypothetical protein